jgi:hypothetical protein
MRNTFTTNIINSKSKISLITDESTTLGKKSTLILYALVFIPGCELDAPINLFIDLIELDDVTASGIFTLLLRHLNSIGISARTPW